MKQTILVTGSAGFIGKAVVARLLLGGYRVMAMCRPGTIPPFAPHPDLLVLYADITEYDSFAKQVKSVDAIVHLAANKYHPRLSYHVNLLGARNIVRLIAERKIRGKRVINISSQSTKIRLRGVYGESKRQSDEILQVPELAWTTLKPSLVYGEGRETLFLTIKNYVQKLPAVPVIGNGRWELYPIDVDDLAQVITRCLTMPRTIHQTYDLGDMTKITFDALIGLIQDELKTNKPIWHIPVWIGLPAVWVVTKLLPSLPITVDNVLGSTQNTHCEPARAVKEIGVRPRSIREGVKKYLGPLKDLRIRVALVGLGKMGILHASVLSAHPSTRVVAIIDREQSLATTAQSMGIDATFYPDLELALKHERVDAVYICTPTFAHEEVIKVCEKAGLPYFVEKPVFPSFASFKNIRVANSAMAGYFWIYKREAQYTRELIEADTIGTVTGYSITLTHGEVFGPKKGWMFVKKLSGGGVLANPGPHALSLAVYLFGRATVKRAKMTYLYGNEVEDRAILQLQHTSVEGEVRADWSVKGRPVMVIEFEIKGSKGTIRFANNELTIRVGKRSKTLSYDVIPSQDVFDLNPRAGGDAYYLETEAFIASLTRKQPFVNSMQFARTIEKIMHEAYAKAQ